MSFTFDLTYPDVAKARRAINLVVVEKVIEIIGMMQLSAEQRSRAATLFVLRLFLFYDSFCDLLFTVTTTQEVALSLNKNI